MTRRTGRLRVPAFASCFALFGLVISGPRAHAQEALQPPAENGRFVGQLGAGAAVMAVGVLGSAALLYDEDAKNFDEHLLVAGAYLVTTGLAGYAVCRVGQRSPYYKGRCSAPVGFAYAGTLGLVLGLGVCGIMVGDDLDSPCYPAALASTVLITPLAAALGWNAVRRPKQPQVDVAGWLPSPHATALAPTSPTKRGGVGGGLVFPVFATQF